MPGELSAQTGEDYCVRYVKEHLVYSDGDEVNVIDVNLEWPVVVDKADMRPLNTYLVKCLMGLQSDDFDTAYEVFKGSFGKPHEGGFATLPDDRKFCYVDLQLKLVGHVPGRYVSFSVNGSCKPGVASSHLGTEVSMMLTYDLVGLRVLKRNDLLRKDKMESAFGHVALELPVFVGDDIYTYMLVRDACLTDGGVLLHGAMQYLDAEQMNLVMTAQDLGGYLTKDAKALLKGSKLAVKPCAAIQMKDWRGEPLYRQADEAPRFSLEGQQLAGYMRSNIKLPDMGPESMKKGRVSVQLVIDKDGWTRDVRVVESLSPEYDRAVVQAVRQLPRWSPARVAGEPVNFCAIIGMEF